MLRRLASFVVVSFLAASLQAAAFTPGNIVVYRVGTGAAALSNASTAVFLDEYTPAGTLVQSIALPTADSGANQILTAAGTPTSEGLLTRSVDGQYLMLAGYDVAPGLASVATTSTTGGTPVPRVIGRVDASGVVDTSTSVTDFSGTNPRGVASLDGVNFWATGGASGARYGTIGSSTTTQLSTAPTNLRAVAIFNGQLYITSASGAFQGVASIGSGTPTTSGHTTTALPGFPTASGPQPYQFVFADRSALVAGVDTVYVADDRATGSGGGIQKWSFDGTTWTLEGAIAVDGTSGTRGLTGAVSGGNMVLYATTTQTNANKLMTYTDTAAFDAAPSGTATLVATASANRVFRGVAFAPQVAAPPAPEVTSILRANPSPTNAASVDWTVTFSESVTGVGTGDFTISPVGVTGAAVSNVTGSGTTWTVTATTGTGDGQIRLDLIDDDSIQNGSAVPLGGPGAQNFTTGEVYGIDKTAPAVQSIVRASANPTNAGNVDFTVTFTEPTIGGGTYGIATTGSLAGTSVTNITGTGATRTVTVATGTGSGDLRLDFIDDDTVTDGVGNTTAANFTAGEVYAIDRTAPAVQSIVRADADPTAASSVDFTVTFTEPVGGVDAADFTLTNTGGIAGASVTGVSGTGATRTVTVNTGTGSGTIRLDFDSNGSVLDPAGNPTTAGFTSGEVYTIDRSAPAVSSITRAGPDPTNASSVNFTVTFSQLVLGVNAGDFVIDATGTFTGASITNVTGAGSTYTVTASWNAGGEGSMSIDLNDDDSIISVLTAEPLGGPGAGNGDFTAGEAYIVDVTPPAVQSVTRADTNPTNAPAVDFLVTFSEPVGGVDAADFTLTTTGPISGTSITDVTGTGATRTVSVNTGSNNGTIRLDVVDNDTINDPAANNLTGGFTGGEVYTVDKLPPLVQSITRANPNPNGALSVDFSVTFSEPVTAVDAADFVLATGGGISGASITGVSGAADTYTVTVNTGTGDGTIRLDLIDNGSIQDPATNPLGGPGPANGDFTTGETYTIARPPLPPTGLAATPGNNSVGLTWNPSAGATGYNVKRSIVSGGPYDTVLSTNQPGTSFTDNTAANGTTYYYVVSALNANGESADTAQVAATPVLPPSQFGVVISQIYPGGGGSTGVYTNDYVELFNRTASDIVLTGYSLQYGSATGNFGSSTANIYVFPATTIGAGRYLTVKVGANGTAGATFTADQTGPTTGFNMAAASGKVALATIGTTLNCGATAAPCALPHPSIIDVVAYGVANNGEGGTTVKNGVALSSSEGALRKVGGCQDTQNNNNDFDVATIAGGLVPRTAATSPNVCPVPNIPPAINAISDPYTTVAENAAPFTVNLTGTDDGGLYTWAATPGTGIASVNVTGGQGTSSVEYTVTLQTNFYGTATFTAALSDGVNPSTMKTVNIAVTRDLGIDHVPTITPPANPYTVVAVNPPPQNVNLTGNDDNNIYNWTATAGAGVQSVIVSAGQGTANVTYDVTIQPAFIGTATFTASLSDGVNPPTNQVVNIGVSPTGSTVTHVVISQFYGGGGNASATYTHDYIELYNPTGSPVSLDGMTLQYGSATTTGSFSGITYLGGIIGPAEYFLVQLASNDTSVGAPLPVAPNLSGDINMSGTNGKIALVGNTDFLSGSCSTLLTDPDIIDLVGYGTANCFEGGAAAPALTSTTANYRDDNGDTDTNHNGNDFTTGSPLPRRTSPIQEIRPFVANTEPGTGDNNAPRDASIEVRFTEPVDVTGDWYDINCATTGNHDSATIRGTFGNTTWVITPNVNFQAGEQCTVTLYASQITDADTDDATPDTDTLPANHVYTFTVSTGTAPAYPTSVHLTFGNPNDAVADTNVPNNYLMEKPELTLSYNLSRGSANWVSWHLADEWVGTLTRVDTFRADPAIPPEWFRVIGSDYSGSGFDRGHMVPNADRDKETSSPINQATFLMTNIIPQAPDNNQGPWANLENYLRTLLPANELYIVAGGHGTGGTGSNGFATTITGGNVTVPAQTWKVVLIIPKASGDDVARVTASSCTLAVLMPNTQGIRSNPNDPNDWMQYLTTVDAIEALTGYDFFEAVPDAIEAAIEGGTNCINPPGAADKTASVGEDGSIGITLEGSSPSNAPLTYIIVTNPSNGQLTGSGANRTYTPNPDYNGGDSFTYKVNDGQDSNVATVTITVRETNDPPSVVDDAKTAFANTPLVFPATDLVANDSKGPANESSQTITVADVAATGSTNGTVTLSGGNVTYTPNPGYSGPASFLYMICDNGTTNGSSAPLCDTGTVNVTVNAAPAPVATHFSVTAPANVTNGVPFNVTVTALDASNATVTGYTGTVHFTSSSTGTLPADYTFVAGDNGSHTFSVTLTTNGAQTITATDTSNASINGTANTTVSAPPQVATHFSVTAPANVTNGVPFNVTVTALDASNATVTGYTGTVHFTSTSTGTLPADYTFVAGDNGSHTFSVTLTTNGAQTITATDPSNASINGTANTTVSAPPQVATHFSVTAPANVTNGVPFNVTVTALDASNATVTGYTGTVHFTSTSTGTLPADYTFVAGDNGSHTFSVTLTTNGAQTITATDTSNASINGTANTNVSAPPQVATRFSVTAPANVTNGVPFNVTVTALDASNATVTGYTGTVHFTSTSTGTLPSDYTFVAGDNGSHTFSVTLTTNGAQTITATDTSNASINGTANVNVACNNGPAQPAAITADGEVCAASEGNHASTITGASTYHWTITNGTITSGQGTASITYTAADAGEIQLHVEMTGPGSCNARSGGASVMINRLPTADLPADIHACAGSSVDINARLTGTGPFTVQWSDGLVQQSRSRNLTRTVTANGTATYTIESVQDAACVNSNRRVRIRVIAEEPVVIADQTRQVKIARGETAQLSITTATSPVTIEWFEGHVGDTSTPVGTDRPSFTTPVLERTSFYWARLTTACGSVDSQQMIVQVGGRSRAVRH